MHNNPTIELDKYSENVTIYTDDIMEIMWIFLNVMKMIQHS